MIVFKNKGLIDLRAVSTFGVSVKATDNPIGFFGTGLKYALAVLLRNNQKVTIWRGNERFDFASRPTDFRGQNINMICMNDVEMGFTLELGKNWEMWMAFRELWCNTIDENGDIFQHKDQYMDMSTYMPEDDTTLITVEGEKFEEIYRNRGEYILLTEPKIVSDEVDVHRGQGGSLFYKGVSVFKLPFPAGYNYNLKIPLMLTEDRTLRYEYQARNAIASLVLESTDEEFIKEFITRGDGSYEHLIDFCNSGGDPEQTFLNVVGKLREDSVDTDQTKIGRAHV